MANIFQIKRYIDQPTSTPSANDHSGTGIKNISVLFTDIVGSSKYFKKQGDIAGRKMLRKHQDIVSPIIKDFSGMVVKFLGDSVMAYFLDPREAVKSAIKIQQGFQTHNQGKGPDDQIHVRICVHFGKGIVERNDIFGDVVNIAAKFLPLVSGGQVFISKKVMDNLAGIKNIHFDLIKAPDSKELLKGLKIYNLTWDKKIHFEPSAQPLLYLRPVFNLGKNSFIQSWERIIKGREKIWKGAVKKETILPDKSIALITNKLESGLDLALGLLKHFKKDLGNCESDILPIQIVIDAGHFLEAGKINLHDFKIAWEKMQPGNIYISEKASRLVKQKSDISISPSPEKGQPGTYYLVKNGALSESKDHAFLYQDAIVNGNMVPCFYCGDKGHAPRDCVSKQITDLTNSTEKLGYLSIEEINGLFFTLINSSQENTWKVKKNESIQELEQNLACQCFFELRSVYQLRLLTTIWNNREDHWYKAKRIKDNSEKGGSLWIGLDCLRVSNHGRGESLLADCQRQDPKDYRTYVATGFLNMEKGFTAKSVQDFKIALNYAKSIPQKTLVLFALARHFELKGDLIKASEFVRRIINLNPYCYEAQYQEIIFRFNKGEEAAALHNLIKLIEKSREYFIYALIDPELSKFRSIIHTELMNMLYKSKNEAISVMPLAEGGLEELKKSLGPEEKETLEAASLFNKIKDLSSSGGYFAYLDVVHFGASIVNLSEGFLKSRRINLEKTINRLHRRHESCMKAMQNLPYMFMHDTPKRKLRKINLKIDKLWEMSETNEPDTYKKAVIFGKELSKSLDQIDGSIKKLENLSYFLQFGIKFLKKNLIFQSASLIIAIILFPIIIHYLNFLIPDPMFTTENTWDFQKIILLFGCISGLILAIVTSAKNSPQK